MTLKDKHNMTDEELVDIHMASWKGIGIGLLGLFVSGGMVNFGKGPVKLVGNLGLAASVTQLSSSWFTLGATTSEMQNTWL